MFAPVFLPDYVHWLMAELVVAILAAGAACSIVWGFRGLVGLYTVVIVLMVLRLLTHNVPFIPGPILIPPLLLVLAFMALLSWTAAELAKPLARQICARRG